MNLLWINRRTRNRFANKHLYVASEALSIMQLYEIGKRIFNERLEAANTNWLSRSANQRRERLRDKYGQAYPPVNSLLVLSIGGFKELEASIIDNGCASGAYPISNGCVFTANNNFHQEGSGGSVNLSVRLVSGTTYEVYHLNSATIGSVLSCTARAANQLRIQSFMPKASDLVDAKNRLKHVPTSLVRDIGWHDLSVDENDGIPEGFFD
jgi:hypothetical protein